MESTKLYLWVLNISDQVKGMVYSIVIGAVGALVVVGFFTGLMSLEAIQKCMPYIIGFNAMLTGFNMIVKADNNLPYKRIYAVASGVVMVVIASVMLNMVMRRFIGGYVVYFADVMWLMAIGGVLSGLGATLAIKYLDINQSH
jgi:hypothetical protein